MTKDELKKMHQAGRRKSILDDVSMRFGCKCANCGCPDDIEYHHIVPLALGGENRSSNIVPLCRRCHLSAHVGRNVKNFKKIKGGRKKTVPTNDMISIFYDFLYCRIPKSVVSKRLGLKRITPKSVSWMRDEMDRLDILEFKNLVELKLVNSYAGVNKGQEVGWWIKKSTGERISILAERTMTPEEFGLTKTCYFSA